MTKTEHITYWLSSSNDDYKTMEYLFKGSRYAHALFFGHLHLEKICKALWVKKHASNYPPRIHNLLSLLEKADVSLQENDLMVLDALNRFQMKGRYPDYVAGLKKSINKKIAVEYIKEIKRLSKCLKEKLQ